MKADNGPSGEVLLVIALLVSLQIAQNRTADELDLLAAFFSVLGDNLALIAVRRANMEAAAEAANAPEAAEDSKSNVKCIDKSGEDV